MESDSQNTLPGAGRDLSCVVIGTQIATPGGQRNVAEFLRGDQVMTASVGSDGGKPALQWSPAEVGFSSGTSAGGAIKVVFIHLDGNEFLCTRDQCLLLANGKYIRADQLRVDMQLVDKDGSGLKVLAVERGLSNTGVHSIATNRPWNGNPNGHLLLANGIVIGDYMVQQYFQGLPDSMKESS